MRAVNQTRETTLVTQGHVAASAWARLRGLLGHPPLRPGEGLLLRGEKAIHTIGMGFPIDVLFLDRSGHVVHMIREMVPLRTSPFVSKAVDVLEMRAGTIAQSRTAVGDLIELSLC